MYSSGTSWRNSKSRQPTMSMGSKITKLLNARSRRAGSASSLGTAYDMKVPMWQKSFVCTHASKVSAVVGKSSKSRFTA